MENTLLSSRLVLRPWQLSDSKDLYELAKNPNVALMTGWNPHQSEEESQYIIEHILCKPHSFAICLSDNTLIGSIGLLFQGDTNFPIGDNEAEIGYWVGEPFWNKGYATEATQTLISYAFKTMLLERLWAGVYTNNAPSKKVVEKCGFTYHHTLEAQVSPLTGLIHDYLIYLLEKN
ncbi:MAG: GNAT family N-acetyltransferase [Capnocytophaga sp.]|nr:GNAT family N-acetyltransferase [Capnocytophaga sp.]